MYARGMTKREYESWYYQQRKAGLLPKLRDEYAEEKRLASKAAIRSAAKRCGVDPDTVPKPGLFCDACGQRHGARAFHLDHDHATGRFRGWLCHHCNVALGCVRDNPETLRKLASYLENQS